ncbi:MAG: helix-turn-helix domain-containing protein [Anaerolineaceae bacterium]|nr:helix-turn-helix domain-containing protein [Anaerolineaceae bacterium]
MVQIPEELHEKIKTIRMSLHFSIHDCAKLLGISQGNYLAFENGEAHLSLPDLEILALYFGLPLEAFFTDQYKRLYQLTLLQDSIRPHYQLLRQKVIRTQLSLERQAAGLTLEQLGEATGIPLETMQGYEEDIVPIPLDDLQKVCQHLGKHIDSFFPDDRQIAETLHLPQKNMLEQVEEEIFTEGDGLDESFVQILAKLREIPKADQAEIAREILSKLKDE